MCIRDSLRRPEVRISSLVSETPALAALGADAELWESVEVDVKYEGYAKRQLEDVARMKRQESREIPADFQYLGLKGLAIES